MSALHFLKRSTRVGIVIGVVGALLAWGMSRREPLSGLEEWFQDSAFSFRGKRPTRAKVVIIGLDDRTLDDVKKPLIHISPELAEVVAYAKKQGATAIGLDMIIPQSLQELPALEEGEAGDATKLGGAIKDAGNVVLSQWKLEDRWLRPVPQWRLKELLAPDERGIDSGFINLTEDDDYFVRRQQLVMKDGDQLRIHFSLALFVRHHNVKKIHWDDEEAALYLDEERIPLDGEQKLRIHFAGPPGTFAVTPLRDVLAAAREGRAMPELAGSIVLIGQTGRTGQDFHSTPYANNFGRALHTSESGLMSGTEIHANVIATLQDRAYIKSAPAMLSLALVLIAGALLGASIARFGLGWGLLFAIVHHFAWKYLCFAVLAYLNSRLEFVAMLTMGFLVYTITIMQRWWTARGILEMTVPRGIAEVYEQNPGQLHAPGEPATISVMFADIRDFTTYAEKHGAAEVVTLLNRYYDVIVPIIERHGGTLTQFMGDGIMALFGAPAPLPDHSLRAVMAARDIVRAVHEHQSLWADHDFKSMRIGVGVHSGQVVVGAVGSQLRRSYTAIGDTTNTAARIERANKTFKTEILISVETYRELPIDRRRELGCADVGMPAEVKGKGQVLTLYEVKVENQA